MKPLGFSRTKETWNRNVGTFVDVFDVQISKTGDRATLNLGVLERGVYAECWGKDPDQFVETPFCTVNARIGELVDQRDEWWPVHDEATVQDMISKTLDLSIPFFERLHSLDGLSEWLARTTSKKGPYPLPSISLAVVQHRLGNRSEACTRLHDLLRKTTGGPVDQLMLTLAEQNAIASMLVQALLGTISPNFRLVSISLSGPVWQLVFILKHDDPLDREEIEDAVGDFDGLLLGLDGLDAALNVEIRVDSGPLPVLDHAVWRTVYRRRESC